MKTDVADTSLDTQVSAADATTLSDDRVETLVPTEDEGTPAAEGETSAQDQATTETLSGPDLQAKFDRGEPLSSQEKESLARHQQSERDRANAQNYARQQRVEAQKRVATLRQQFPDIIANVVDKAAEEGRLVKDAAKELGDTLFSALEPVVVQPYEAFIRNDAFALMGGDRKAAERLADADGFVGAIDIWREALINHGKTLSEDGKKLTKLQADYDKLKADHAKLMGSDSKGSGASTQGKPASAGTPTYEQLLKMKPEEIARIPGDVYLRVINGG